MDVAQVGTWVPLADQSEPEDEAREYAPLVPPDNAPPLIIVNRRNRGNWTAMHFAVREGSIEMVQMLLRAGADVHPRNGMGHTALEEAVYNRKRRLYPLLLAAGAGITGRLRANDAYLRKVATMGFPRYEKAHRTRLTATCARVVFPRLPVDAVKARGLAVATDVAVLRVDLRVREMDFDA